MCMDRINKSVIIKERTIAWKVVTKTKDPTIFRSRVDPWQRSREDGFPTSGKNLFYAVNEWTESQAPGIYCYREKDDISHNSERAIIEVTIPVGARAYIGIDGGLDVICAERVHVNQVVA